MSVPVISQPVKLFCGIIFKDNDSYPEVIIHDLIEAFGGLCLKSPIIDFVFTDYYSREMGEPLRRMWIAFDKLIEPDDLVEIKLETNNIENRFMDNEGNRSVNIDPGYLCLSKIILASAKNYSHRIYLREGIYGQVDFRYIDNTWQPLEWTYPDYQSATCTKFMNELRAIYKSQLNGI
ncbi:DUF4416 family protein [bacterium]|nr:DUF4416 family protein [bacterium]